MNETDKKQAREVTHLYVHGGMMHADDVLAAAMLKELRPDLVIERVRALPDPLPDHALAADIGGGVFDHHQPDAALREDGHKHAACGLVLEAVQDDLFPDGVPAPFAEDVRSIEDQDNGVAPGKENPLTNLVRGMNPQWDETRTLDQAFSEAVDFVQAEYLKPYRERGKLSLAEQKILTDKQAVLDARRADATEKAKTVVRDAFARSDGFTVVFDKAGVPWKDALCPTSARYVVYPSARGGWNLQCVPPEPRSFAQKEPLPESWLSKEGREQSGATFVHPGRFLAAFPTRETAIAGAELSHAAALQNEFVRGTVFEAEPGKSSEMVLGVTRVSGKPAVLLGSTDQDLDYAYRTAGEDEVRAMKRSGNVISLTDHEVTYILLKAGEARAVREGDAEGAARYGKASEALVQSGEIRPDAMDARMMYADFCGKTELLAAMQQAAEEAFEEDVSDGAQADGHAAPSGEER